MILNYIGAGLECASIFIITSSLEKERKKVSVVRILICIVAYMLYFLANMYMDLAAQFSFLGYVVIYLCIKWLYREDIVYTLVITVLSAVFAGIVEFLVAYVVVLTLTDDTEETGLYVILVTSITFVVVICLSRLKINKILDVLERWDFTYAIVGVLSLMIFAPLTLVRIMARLDVEDYVYIAVCIVVMWLLIMKIQQYKIDAKIRKQYFEAYKDVLVQIRRRQHKIKNQINAAYSMFRIYDTYDELVAKQKEYLSKILDYELPNDAIILEEPSIIALIYEKINEAVELGIQMQTSFSCSMAVSRVSDVTWVDLISTLFDNAIEALEEYDGEKKIWLEIGYADKNQISMRVVNTFHKVKFQEISQFFEMGYSTKGTGRGVGLYNVKQIVHKNHGDISAMSMERDGLQVFVIEIII